MNLIELLCILNWTIPILASFDFMDIRQRAIVERESCKNRVTHILKHCCLLLDRDDDKVD
jgi:hypothetical protein